MTKVNPRTVGVKIFLLAVDPWHSYLNESERANEDIYDDFKLKKPHLVAMFFYKLIQRFKGYYRTIVLLLSAQLISDYDIARLISL